MAETGDAIGVLAEARWESWRAVMDVAARQQELGVRLAFGWLGSTTDVLKEQASNNLRITRALTEQQARAFRALSQRPVYGVAGLFFGVPPVAGGTASRNGRANGRGLPVEDYDRLSVEEVGGRLEALGPEEVEELKAYEKRHKNRASLLERLDRALV